MPKGNKNTKKSIEIHSAHNNFFFNFKRYKNRIALWLEFQATHEKR